MRAFSLVELSIVLVILGLLTGGILAGQSLIKAAEMRKVQTEATRMVTALYSFRDRYMALPGDMVNAYNFWGASAGCANTVVSVSPYTGCNGNGDGNINDYPLYGEDLRAYQFMALSGLIEGNYPGQVMPSGNKRQFGANIPPAITKNAGWWLNQLEVFHFGKGGNNLLFGIENVNSVGSAALLPEEAWNIDIKLDDGNPATGRITPAEPQTTCYDSTTQEYILTTTSITCSMIYWLY